jgi:DNA polymerase-3 subunit delta
MPSVKPEEFKRSLEARELKPVYLLHGDDARSVDRGLAGLEALVLPEGMAEFNADYFHGKETDVAAVLAAAHTLPMMAEKRLVMVKRVDEVKGADRERLIAYMADPVATTVLALAAGPLALRGTGRKKEDEALDKAAAKAGLSVNFGRPTAARLPVLIQEMARERGKQIEKDAVDLLAELAGDEMLGLEQELEKVSLYMGDKKKIGRDDVLKAVADVKEANVYQFTDAIGARDLEAALRVFRRMGEEGLEPIMILGMVLRHFRLIWKIQDCKARGETPAAMAKKVGLGEKGEWVIKKVYLPQLDKFPAKDTGRILRALADLDIKLKSVRAEKDVLFERTIIKLCLGRLA